MNKVQLHLLAFFFAAFLPNERSSNSDDDDMAEDEQDDYYTILGLKSSSGTGTGSITQDDIRKAYKKKSLQYHPDKVAQFANKNNNNTNNNNNNNNNKTPEQIQADFVKIKEAYETLSNVDKRNAYDVLGPQASKALLSSNSGFGGIDPNFLLLNLATASYINKTKLFVLVLFCMAIVLLGPLLICAKIDAILYNNKNTTIIANTSWIVILIPIWIFNVIHLILLLIALLDDVAAIVRMISIFLLELFLALRFDNTIQWEYKYILIPGYIHQCIVLLSAIYMIYKVREDVARMVTVSYLEEKILPDFRMDDYNIHSNPTNQSELNDDNNDNDDGGHNDDDEEEVPMSTQPPQQRRYYNDLSEEEMELINKLYVVVNIDDDDDDDNDNNDHEENNNQDPEIKLLFDIAKSDEFAHASLKQKYARDKIQTIFLFRITFLILLVLKLDQDKDWDWNLVFCTIWIEVCLQVLKSCFYCHCAGVVTEKTKVEYASVSEHNDDDDGNGNGGGNCNGDDIEKGKHDKNTTSVNFPISINTDDNGDNDDIINNNDIIKNSNNHPTKLGDDETHTIPITGEETKENQEGDTDTHSETEFRYESTVVDQEKMVMAYSNCCFYSFVIIGLALFLVKLNGADDGIKKYSAYWVLFPVLFIAGCILCCCCCCIYASVSPDNLENFMAGRRNNANNNDDTENDDANNVGSNTNDDGVGGNSNNQDNISLGAGSDDDLD